MIVITRFAPSPTGYLHLGHVRNAIEVWNFAREHGGKVLLRIEDHDRQRSKPAFEAAIREDLAWLGFAPDAEVPRQSERDAAYREVLSGLVAQGLVYGCTCTRAEIINSHYEGTCRNLTIGLRPDVGWRIRIEPGVELFDDLRIGPQQQDPSAQCGDLLIRDRLGNWTYQWAATIDDYLQGVTHVIRGEDLLDSTGRQIRLARLAGRPEPATFLHHALIMRSPGKKLSKSDGDTGIRELRARGFSREDVTSMALHGPPR
ncbi:MAG: tRNA glutamyl-Q(34) synthetase GluQRS [Acidobacteria bacterium]|nr:MAG: tRNA glutamyl-Q(34) synthetase GluQRS [Acidobacteriota bacterium]